LGDTVVRTYSFFSDLMTKIATAAHPNGMASSIHVVSLRPVFRAMLPAKYARHHDEQQYQNHR